VYLTKEEEKIYDGEFGVAERKAMEILVALGDIYEADRLISIRSAHISGVSYKTIGDAGLEWIRSLKGRVAVHSTLNPMGMDRSRWMEMGISAEFARKQMEIIRSYEEMGISAECTCTPYYTSPPGRGDHLAWSESSAVSYANSVIGAMTNREGGPSALAAAILGKTPRYGYHLDEGRIPNVTIKINFNPSDADYGALGCVIGEMIGDGIPLIELKSKPNSDELKSLGAAMAASGSIALYHIGDERSSGERVEIEKREIEEFYDTCGEEPDLIFFGCPHCSSEELKRINMMVGDKKIKREAWIFASRSVMARERRIVGKMRNAGIKVFCDTCPIVSPCSEQFDVIMTNSGKALRYLPNVCGVNTIFAKTYDCINRMKDGC
jgi:hypothetical protein